MSDSLFPCQCTDGATVYFCLKMSGNDKSLIDSLNMITSRLSFKNDPKWLQIDTTIKILVYTLIQNINTCINLYNAQKYVADDTTTAGVIFNGVFANHPQATNTTFSDEINDNDLMNFCVIFKNNMDKDSRLGVYSRNIQDPVLCTFEFIHYLFIPVRMDVSTLTDEMKINHLRKFITILCFLPYMEGYTQKYIAAINNTEFMQKVHSTIMNRTNNIANQMMAMKSDFIFKSLQINYTHNNSMMIYLRVYCNILLLISMEILKKWCPNIIECMRINPNFDGAWVNPFDSVVNEQIQSLQDFCKIIRTEKMV